MSLISTGSISLDSPFIKVKKNLALTTPHVHEGALGTRTAILVEQVPRTTPSSQPAAGVTELKKNRQLAIKSKKLSVRFQNSV
jgi:hypothetical protein